MENTSKKRMVLRREGRQMIANVYHFLKNEYEFTELHREPNCKCDFTHLRYITKRTAKATGVSKRTVEIILKEERETLSKGNDGNTSVKFTLPMKNRRKRKNKVDIDERTAEVIRSTIEDFNVSQEAPTLAKLKTVLNEKNGFNGCRSTLNTLLRKMGYTWHKVRSWEKKSEMLVQRHDNDTQNCTSEYSTKTANQDNSDEETDSVVDSCYDST